MSRILVFITFTIFITTSCNPTEAVNSEEKPHFDLNSFMSQELMNIQNSDAKLIKQVSFDIDTSGSNTKTVEPKSNDVEELYNLLSEYNINLPNLKDSYTADTTKKSNKTKVVYTPDTDRLDIKNITLSFTDNKIDTIAALKSSEGFFSSYEENIQYQPGGYFEVLKAYKVILSDSSSIRISLRPQ